MSFKNFKKNIQTCQRFPNMTFSHTFGSMTLVSPQLRFSFFFILVKIKFHSILFTHSIERRATNLRRYVTKIIFSLNLYVSKQYSLCLPSYNSSSLGIQLLNKPSEVTKDYSLFLKSKLLLQFKGDGQKNENQSKFSLEQVKIDIYHKISENKNSD